MEYQILTQIKLEVMKIAVQIYLTDPTCKGTVIEIFDELIEKII